MKILRILTAAAAIIGMTASAFAAPIIGIYATGGYLVTENVSAKFENLTNFGSVLTAGGTRAHAFYIRNDGNAGLVINSVNVTGTGFSITEDPDTNVDPNDFTYFIVTFDPTSDGFKMGKVTVGSNAPNNPLFEFNIAGTGVASLTAKPDLSSGIITTVKEKTITKKGITYLKGKYIVPIQNQGATDYTKKTSVMKVISTTDRHLDDGDTRALKAIPIKKSIEQGHGYNMKVNTKVKVPPGTQRIVFQIESPDDYESYYGNNIRFESYP